MPKKIAITGSEDILLAAKHLTDFEFVAVTGDVAKSLGDMDIPNKFLGSFISENMQAQSMSDAAMLSLGILQQVPEAKKRLHPRVQEKFTQVMPGFLMNNLPQLALLVGALDVANVDGAILHNDVEPLTRTIALWCKARGKPCYHIPHAIYLDHGGRGAPGSDIHDMVTASHLAAGGMFQRNWYVERGFPVDHIGITGVPRFDRITKLPQNRERAGVLLKLNTKKPTVVYFSSWSQQTNLLGCNDEMEESYLAFLDAVKGTEDVEVIVKCHPRGQNIDWHIKKAQEKDVRAIVTAKYLDVIMQVMTVGISYGPSNVILESSMLNHRLASVGGFVADPEIMTMEPTAQSIRQGIMTLMANPIPNYTNFWLKYLGIPDGQAAIRVASYAREVFK